MTHAWSLLTDQQLLTLSRHNQWISRLVLCTFLSGSFLLLGCPTDNAPLKQENLQLKKQAAKLESVVLSLQEGNKVTQQQIDLLNREARKTQEHYEQELKKANEKIKSLSQGNKQDNSHLQLLEQKNEKLRKDAKWLRTLREQWRKGLKIQKKGGNEKDIDDSFLTVIDATQATLTQNGYAIRLSMQTDLKAVYLTDRKISRPTSLELTGFRNHYIVSIDKISPEKSNIWVKAEFEKFSQNAHILNAGKNEISEIELRLIQEIEQSIENTQPSKYIVPPK